jgi:ketopantoate reductase
MFWTHTKTVADPGRLYTIHIDWTYEGVAIRDMFDETVSDVADMERRCDAGIDTHFVTRVRAFWRGYELASTTLGSCYALDCSPEDEIEAGLAGYLEDLIDEVVAEADRELVRLNRALIEDVAEVDKFEA